MPASSSETKNRWRKRKRGEQPSKPKFADDEDYDEEEDDVDLDHQPPHPEFADEPSNSPDPVAAAGAENDVVSNSAVRISAFPPVIKHTVNQHHCSVNQIVAMERASQAGQSSSGDRSGVVLENISHGQLQALSAMAADALAEDSEGSFVITPPPMMEGNGVVKRYGSNRVHVVPMHADWFSPTTINRIERQAISHFFSGNSTDYNPQKYMDYRNRIVAKYMENPSRRLSASDCHGFLVGVDSDDITRIFRFLENWGVINYCAAPPNNHSSRNEGSNLTEDLNGELCVPATTLQSIDSLIRFDKPKCRIKAEEIYPELKVFSGEDTDLDSRIREILAESQCNCCFRPLSFVRYQSLKEIEVLLCLDCYNEGAFVVGHSSLDFIKVDPNKDYGDPEGDSWSNQETLLLLEAMELFNENWIKIADHVGTKSKAQCIIHFVRLSIDEIPLENIEVPVASSSSNGGHPQSHASSKGSIVEDPNFETRFTFKKSGNPVMSQVAFLASAVGPRVAAACAHASLVVLSEDDDMGASENAGVSENRTINGCTSATLTTEKVKNAVRAGIAAAAMKAKLFADHEEREIQRLCANITNNQLKRLELKLKQFAEIETLLMKECEQVERARQRVAAERALILGTPGPTMVNHTMVNQTMVNRLQVSGSQSQPFISGYPNHPVHPQMYGFGQRLPLSAINPSPSSNLQR